MKSGLICSAGTTPETEGEVTLRILSVFENTLHKLSVFFPETYV